MSDLDLTEAVAAAARAMWDYQDEDGHWDEVGAHAGDNADHCRAHAHAAVAAAAPLIEQAVREQKIARELKTVLMDHQRDGIYACGCGDHQLGTSYSDHVVEQWRVSTRGELAS